jgi:hypothetical protein
MNIEVEDPAFRGRNQSQPVVSFPTLSLPVLPALSLSKGACRRELVEGSLSKGACRRAEGVEPISEAKKSCCGARMPTADSAGGETKTNAINCGAKYY